MRFFLVAASAAVALISALAGLLGWTRPKGGKYGSESDESGGEDEKVGVGDGAPTSSTPSPRARRRGGKKTQNGQSPRHSRGGDPRSARQLAWMGLSALWDAFTGRYLARTTRDLWRAAASRSPSPQPREQRRRRSAGAEAAAAG